MLFNSLAFFVFFAAFLLVWSLLRDHPRQRIGFLLVASYVFYGWWDPRFCLLLAYSTTVDYCVGRAMRGAAPRRRKQLLGVAIASNVGVLCAFKYFDFFASSLEELFGTFGMELDFFTVSILLPVGISFYTFQSLSYSIDVYRGDLEPSDDWVAFAAFVSMFPQLVAGPIVRAKELLPKIRRPIPLDQDRLVNGLLLMMRGYVKKVVVADSLAPYVAAVFAEPDQQAPITLAVGAVFFAAQLYGDFSGYSDIAVGVARIIGYDFPDNFRYPYLARSMSEFWRRWHITLSTWLRDYVYIPLGGSRGSSAATTRNLFLTMLLGGLWHGASWTFVAWGAVHGGLLALGRWSDSVGGLLRLPEAVRWPVDLVRTNVLWVLTLILFRSQSGADAVAYFKGLLGPVAGWNPALLPSKVEVFEGFFVIGILFLVDLLWAVYETNRLRVRTGSVLVPAAAATTILTVAFLGTFQGNAFIYFQF